MAADTPVIILPTASAVLPWGERDSFQFLKTPYSGAGTQREVYWQIATDSGFAAATIVRATLLRENDDHVLGDDWLDVFPAAIPLAAGTTYYVRVQVRNTSNETSSWSATVTFTTASGVSVGDWARSQG